MKNVTKLIESALLIAIATVLSFIKVLDLPAGGSVTAASMLPVIIIAYRHGFGYGFFAGVVYGIIQQLAGLNTLSYVTGWQSVVAVVVLDYVAAFAACSLGGIFRNKIKHSSASLALGAVAACIVRYICHVISGATVWAGLSIPTNAALTYSFAYNATYMIPETLVLVIAGYYIASNLDFTQTKLQRVRAESGGIYALVIGLVTAGALIYDTVAIFSVMQDADSGEFTLANMSSAPWTSVAIVTVVATVISLLIIVVKKLKKEK